MRLPLCGKVLAKIFISNWLLHTCWKILMRLAFSCGQWKPAVNCVVANYLQKSKIMP